MGEGEDDADEVCSTRRCCRSGSRRTDFSCRDLSSEDGVVEPLQSTDEEELDQLADEAVRLPTPLITNTAAEALPGTQRNAERRPARGYIQQKGRELWGGSAEGVTSRDLPNRYGHARRKLREVEMRSGRLVMRREMVNLLGYEHQE